MTQAEKLEALIWRAINDGWKPATEIAYEGQIRIRDVDLSVFSYDDLGEQRTGYYRYSVNDILFNHDFARALFGEEERGTPTEAAVQGINLGGSFDRGGVNMFEVIINKGWQYHLQQAVISDDPIDYMYEAVFE